MKNPWSLILVNVCLSSEVNAPTVCQANRYDVSSLNDHEFVNMLIADIYRRLFTQGILI